MEGGRRRGKFFTKDDMKTGRSTKRGKVDESNVCALFSKPRRRRSPRRVALCEEIWRGKDRFSRRIVLAASRVQRNTRKSRERWESGSEAANELQALTEEKDAKKCKRFCENIISIPLGTADGAAGKGVACVETAWAAQVADHEIRVQHSARVRSFCSREASTTTSNRYMRVP